MNLAQVTIDHANKYGYKHEYPGPYEVTATALNIRLHPIGSAPIVGRLIQGNRIIRLNSVGDWFQIKEGWIHSDYVEAV